MKKRLMYAYVFFLHVLLGLVLLKSDFSQRIGRKLGVNSQINCRLSFTGDNFQRSMLYYHSRMDGNVPRNSVIFIGDSITQGLCVSAVVSPSVNYGIGGDTTAGVLDRIETYTSIQKADAIVIAVGINDMGVRSDDEIMRNYARLVTQVPPNIPLIFSAILPINEKRCAREWFGGTCGLNDRLKSINVRLQKLTMASSRICFVDAGPSLVDARGNLSDEFHDGDGVHLNAKGNSIWIQHLRTAIETAKRSSIPR